MWHVGLLRLSLCRFVLSRRGKFQFAVQIRRHIQLRDRTIGSEKSQHAVESAIVQLFEFSNLRVASSVERFPIVFISRWFLETPNCGLDFLNSTILLIHVSMGLVFSSAWRQLTLGSEESKIVVVGLSNAGKTTILLAECVDVLDF